MSHKRRIFSLISLLCVGYATTARANIITYSDTTFNPSAWGLNVISVNRGGTATVSQQTKTASTDTYRQVTITLNSAAGTGTDSQVYAYNLFNSAVYNPTTQGSILSLQFTEDRDTSGAGQEMGPALLQNGTYYYAYADSGTTNLTWKTVSKSATSSSFQTFNTAATPDFSATGASITFGFVAINNTGTNGSGSSTVAAYDNWSIVLTNTAVPEPSMVTDTLLVASATTLLRRRRINFN